MRGACVRPRMHPIPWIVALVALASLSCSAGDTDCAPGLPCAGTAQVPATGKLQDVDAWLQSGSYKTWKCEKEAHPARSGSAHDSNRICSNDLLSGTTSGEYPVGAANVKELYDGNRVAGYAMMVKVAKGTGGNAWYFYEKLGSGSIPANGVDDGTCTGCHSGAPRDYVFTQVR